MSSVRSRSWVCGVAGVMAVAMVGSGCSMLMSHPKENYSVHKRPRCTKSRFAPYTDLIVGGVTTAASAGESTGWTIAGATLLASGVYGMLATSRCRGHYDAYNGSDGYRADSMIATARAAAPLLRRDEPEPQPQPEPPEVAAQSSPEDLGFMPPPPPAPAVAPPVQQAAVQPAATSPPADKSITVATPITVKPRRRVPRGGALPAPEDKQGKSCTTGAQCGAGLHCDRETRTCKPGSRGREGGTCHPDGSCDPGFACTANLCIRAVPPRSRPLSSLRSR